MKIVILFCCFLAMVLAGAPAETLLLSILLVLVVVLAYRDMKRQMIARGDWPYPTEPFVTPTKSPK